MTFVAQGGQGGPIFSILARPPSCKRGQMEQHKARRRWPVMQAKRNEDLKDSFYLYIMRSSIGAGMRSQYSLNGHMPGRLAELLQELERAGDGGARGRAAKEEHHPKTARKRARKR